ncbi:hypothetical protein GQ55_2G252900 [Panicum hallii var. hallii]|uniref:NAC domain-containing protein n=2 Tax=Panicum hallii TaxID=206008 RepID=A0A2T7ES83_9POAL|nr:hypothetical protein GQ55_2G252900 [Panicum hallii var. hallii]PVH64408.1 hypothetical protein PAHAL_2G261700 [Panicum hallii]
MEGYKMGGGDGRLPPGFRFRPTDEELLTHYLAPKAADAGFAPAAVREVDLYRSQPWDLLPAAGGGGGCCYFFCRRSVKFPSGLRTNRATRAGYWKSTGKDKVVTRQHGGGSIDSGRGEPLGLKKTLVFYRGRAPTGEKTNWVMHEYRLVQGHGYTSPMLATGSQSEWVICRMFMRKAPGEKSLLEEETVPHSPLNNGHLQPSFDGCNGGKTTTAVGEASNPEHANCFSDALAIAPADRHHETACQGALQLNREAELLMNCSASDYASAAAPASELQQQATLLLDELSSDCFDDLLPQLLDYEGLPFLQDF